MYLLLIILIIILLLGLPQSPYPFHAYGWYPSGILGILVLVLIVLLLTGHL